MIIYYMINIIPQCVICGSPVSDLVEPEVEKQGQLKAGHYVDNRWICNDCVQSETTNGNKERRSNNNCDVIGKASAADVSPNTPKADEASM
jgi:hypothetical protein